MKIFSILLCCLCGIVTYDSTLADMESTKNERQTATQFQDLSKKAMTFNEIAVVDLKELAKQSKAGQSIDVQLAEINDESKQSLIDLENSIKKMDSHSKDSNKDESEVRKVEDLQVMLYNMTKDKRYQIQLAYKSALSTLEQEMHKVIQEIAEEKGYKLVIISDVVVYRSMVCDDITQLAINRLDQKIDRIVVNMQSKNELNSNIHSDIIR